MKRLQTVGPEFCFWEKPCCSSPLAAAGLGWRSVSLPILNSVYVTSLTAHYHNKLFHIFPSCIQVILEAVIFLALVQVPQSSQFCCPIPANMFPHLLLFPTVINLKILSRAFHVGGFPFSAFSSSFIISSTQYRILCFKSTELRLGPPITLTLVLSVPSCVWLLSPFSHSCLLASWLWERGEMVIAPHD